MRRAILVIWALAMATALSACGGDEETGEERGAGELPNASKTEVREEREIAFARSEGTTEDRFSDILVMDADGSGKTRLTDSPDAADTDPAFSPDGERIAFTRAERKRGDIYVMNADGTEETRLTDSSGSPTFSPDGERIAFVSNRDGPGIYVMNADGTDVTRLTNGRYDNQPAWSPDGRRIAFARGVDVYLMNADGSDEANLTNGSALDGVISNSPAFSPDGQRIAFLGVRQGAASRVVWAMNADGSDPAPLSNRPRTGLSFSSPTFSPDGKRIAFVGDAERDGPGIYVMNADGTDQERLPGGLVNDASPAWSPASDGSP